MIEHGTYRGYQKCRKRYAGSCDECKEANRLYTEQWNAKHPESRKELNHNTTLRRRALIVLGTRHEAELKLIIAEMQNNQK